MLKRNMYRLVGTGAVVIGSTAFTAVAAHAATLGRFGRY